MFDEDPVNYVCRLIIDTLMDFVRLIELVLKYLLWMAWSPIRSGAFLVRRWIARAGSRLQQFGSYVYWEHVRVWLVVTGFRRELTWVEIEERRLQAIARTGVDIPRPPALEAGLQQEMGLDV